MNPFIKETAEESLSELANEFGETAIISGKRPSANGTTEREISFTCKVIISNAMIGSEPSFVMTPTPEIQYEVKVSRSLWQEGTDPQNGDSFKIDGRPELLCGSVLPQAYGWKLTVRGKGADQ